MPPADGVKVLNENSFVKNVYSISEYGRCSNMRDNGIH